MSSRDFRRGERGRERWDEDWGAPQRSSSRYYSEDEDFDRRGWREGSDYYGPQRSSSVPWRSGSEFERERQYGTRDDWRSTLYSDRNRGYGNYQPERSFNDRWEESYGPRASRETYTGRRDRESGMGYEGSTGRRFDRNRTDVAPDVSTGPFKGRGPKGYRRSDDRVREDVCERLTDDSRVDASEIEVNVKDCEVTLSGSVRTREEKRRAEDLTENVSGVKDVHNTLRVTSEAAGTSEATGWQGGTQPHH